jgi:hypothetical protein
LPYLAYGAVAGLTLSPLVEAFVRSGRPDSVLMVLYGVAGGVGDNLVAEQLQRWHGRASSAPWLSSPPACSRIIHIRKLCAANWLPCRIKRFPKTAVPLYNCFRKQAA